MSIAFLLLVVLIMATIAVQLGLGYDFAVSHLMNRIPFVVRTLIQLIAVVIFAAGGWFIGQGAEGREHVITAIAIAGIVGFVFSHFWYLKYPTPPRRPFRNDKAAYPVYYAPRPTPSHLISFDRTEAELHRMGQRVDIRA